jgi:hypothetical protein
MSDRIGNALCFFIAAGACAMIAMAFGTTPHDGERYNPANQSQLR